MATFWTLRLSTWVASHFLASSGLTIARCCSNVVLLIGTWVPSINPCMGMPLVVEVGGTDTDTVTRYPCVVQHVYRDQSVSASLAQRSRAAAAPQGPSI